MLGVMNANEIPQKTNSRMNRIQNVSGAFRTIFFVIAILCAFGGVGVIVPILFVRDISKVEFVAMGGSEWACAILAWCCYKLFRLYSRGEMFTPNVVISIRRVGYAYFLMAIVGFICQMALLHFQSGESHPVATQQTWPINLLTLASMLFPGFLIIFVAWIMDEGRKIREEQELTV